MKKILLIKLIVSLHFFSYSYINATESLILKSVNNIERKNEHIKRDDYRNPTQTLNFFGIKSDMRVLEILPGKGYYTEILSHFLKDKGKLTVASFGNDHPIEYLKNMHIEFEDYFNKKENYFGKVKITKFKNKNYLPEVIPNSIDLVLSFRNSHNWINRNKAEEIYQSIYSVIKKDGILGIVQHRADNPENKKIDSKTGYIEESFLIKIVESVGFKLVSKSEINKNSLDTKDHPEGVWTLPPTFRLKKIDKVKYTKIGESDRMTLKFIKK